MDAVSWIRFSQRSFRVRGRIRQRAAGFLRMRSAFHKSTRLTTAPSPATASIGIRNLLACKPVAGPAAVATATVESPRAVLIPLTNTAVAQTPWIIARPSDPTVINRPVFQNRNDGLSAIGRCSSSRVSVPSTVWASRKKKENVIRQMRGLDTKFHEGQMGLCQLSVLRPRDYVSMGNLTTCRTPWTSDPLIPSVRSRLWACPTPPNPAP